MSALRKVLDSVNKQQQFEAIMLVAPMIEETTPQPAAAALGRADQQQVQVAAATQSGADDKALVQDVQRRLNELGYNAGPADGVAGRGTRSAIREYQQVAGLGVDGQPSMALLDHMNSGRRGGKPGTGREYDGATETDG